MANRDFKKIERIMKDFSLGVGKGGSSGDGGNAAQSIADLYAYADAAFQQEATAPKAKFFDSAKLKALLAKSGVDMNAPVKNNDFATYSMLMNFEFPYGGKLETGYYIGFDITGSGATFVTVTIEMYGGTTESDELQFTSSDPNLIKLGDVFDKMVEVGYDIPVNYIDMSENVTPSLDLSEYTVPETNETLKANISFIGGYDENSFEAYDETNTYSYISYNDLAACIIEKQLH